MGIYTKTLNESYVIESKLNTLGIEKDDLKDKDKVKKIVEKDEKGKNRTVLKSIEVALAIIGLIIFAVPLTLALPVILPLYFVIGNKISKIKDKRKNKEIDKICNSYKKNIDKLTKQLQNTKDKEERKEIEKVIKSFKSEIDKLEKEKIKSDYENKIKPGLDLINSVYKKETIPSYYDECSLWLFYNDIPLNKFESRYLAKKEAKDIMKYIAEEDEDFKSCFEKYKQDKWHILYTIDDMLLFYNSSKHLFCYGDWDSKSLKFVSFNDFKNSYKKFNDYYWEDIVKADQYLGCYKLSEAPDGVEPVE